MKNYFNGPQMSNDMMMKGKMNPNMIKQQNTPIFNDSPLPGGGGGGRPGAGGQSPGPGIQPGGMNPQCFQVNLSLEE